MRTFLLALAASLLVAAPAYAGSSNITTPGDGTFPVLDNNAGNLTVAGTASGFTSADIICTDGNNDNLGALATNVPVSGDGSFSTTVELNNANDYACVLRAVPAGTFPADTEPYAGPRIGVGNQSVTTVPSGWTDFDLDLAPFGGYASFDSLGEQGVSATYAEDPDTLAYSDEVFTFGDSLYWDDFSATRSEVQVDGANAYFADGLYSNNAPHYPSDPLPTLSVDPTTGLGSASSQQTLAKCSPGGAFPPNATNCANDVPVGVRVDHTATALDDGDLVSTADTFVSVDGQAHDIDLLYATSATSGTSTWRFPDETEFTSHAAGKTLTTFPTGPAAATLDQDGSDYGVFAWGTPPDKVTFGAPNYFEAHYLVHIPAGGSSTIGFAYGTTFTLDQAQALTPAAIAAVTPPPPPAPPAAPPPTPVTPPAVPARPRLKFHVKSNGTGTVTVIFRAPAAGTLSGLETAVAPRSAKKKTKKLIVSKAHKRVTKAGTVKLVLKLNKKGMKIFRAGRKLRTTLALTFKPNVGTATKLKPKHLTLKLKKKHHRKH